MKPPKLVTERLLLNGFTAGDAEHMFRYAGDPERTRYMGWPRHQSLEDSKDILAHFVEGYAGPAAGFALAIRLQDGRLIGSTGLDHADQAWVNTGWILAPEAEGKGYAREAMSALMDWARNVLPGSGRVQATVHAENTRSLRLARALGFREQGTLLHRMPNLDGQEHALHRFVWEPRACRP